WRPVRARPRFEPVCDGFEGFLLMGCELRHRPTAIEHGARAGKNEIRTQATTLFLASHGRRPAEPKLNVQGATAAGAAALLFAVQHVYRRGPFEGGGTTYGSRPGRYDANRDARRTRRLARSWLQAKDAVPGWHRAREVRLYRRRSSAGPLFRQAQHPRA